MKLKIPCEYSLSNSRPCENGQLFIYGDLPMPGYTIVCPKCHGTSMVEISREDLTNKIVALKGIIKACEEDLEKYTKYLENK